MKNKIILDTNVIISFLISANSIPGKVVNHTINNHNLISSDDILSEIMIKLVNKKFSKFFSISDAKLFIAKFQSIIHLYNPKNSILLCRDKKDNMFLELANISNANYIITGDKDLLEIKNFNKT